MGPLSLPFHARNHRCTCLSVVYIKRRRVSTSCPPMPVYIDYDEQHNALVLKQVSFLLKEMLTWLGSPSTPSSRMIPCKTFPAVDGCHVLLSREGSCSFRIYSRTIPRANVRSFKPCLLRSLIMTGCLSFLAFFSILISHNSVRVIITVVANSK
jgi:hypothetical protein